MFYDYGKEHQPSTNEKCPLLLTVAQQLSEEPISVISAIEDSRHGIPIKVNMTCLVSGLPYMDMECDYVLHTCYRLYWKLPG